MKNSLKIIAAILLTTMTFGVYGCFGDSEPDTNSTQTETNSQSGGNQSENNNQSGKEDPLDILEPVKNPPDGIYQNLEASVPDAEGTIHEVSVGKTAYKLLSGGKTDYKLLIPEEADGNTLKAVSEFNLFFEEATGLKLQTVSDDDYAENGKYISFGKTKLLEKSGITIDYKVLGNQGYEIITKGDDVYVAGGSKGVYYGVSDVLYYTVGYEQFTDKIYSLEKGVKDLTLPDFDIKEVPDIEYRIAPYGTLFMNSTARDRMRTYHDSEVFIDQCKIHSSFNIVPLSNQEEHPGWFSDDGNQLCYTAHGNASEYQKLVDYSVESCKNFILADPYHDKLSFSQRDINVWCGCSACSALKAKYGTDAASQIKFINDVAEKIDVWAKEAVPERDIKISILAYHKTEKAPVKQNADGTYSPIDDSVKLRPNVFVYVAPIGADYISGINEVSNIGLKTLFETWQAITDEYSVWGYDCYFGAYLTPYDSFNSIQDLAKFLKALNTSVYFPQGAYNMRRLTNFDDLKNYLHTKLMWNVNTDLPELIDRFFDGVYKEAAGVMKEAYARQRANSYDQRLNGLAGSIWYNVKNEKYFTKRYLLEQIELIESAYAQIAKYKDADPVWYSLIYDEITAETVGPRYMLYEIFGATLSSEESKEIVKRLSGDLDRLGFEMISEGTSVSAYIASINS